MTPSPQLSVVTPRSSSADRSDVGARAGHEALEALVHQSIAAAGESGEPYRLLRGLAALAPDRVVDWLASMPDAVRHAMDKRQAARLIADVIDGALTDGNGHPAKLFAIVRAYADLLDAGALASVLHAHAEAFGDDIAPIMEAALIRFPSDPELLRLAAEYAARAGNAQAAHRHLAALARSDRRLPTLRWLWRQRRALPADGVPVRIALLGSFTLDPLLPFLDMEARDAGLVPEFYVAPFNAWAQEVLDPASGLYDFQPDVTILAISIDDLIPDLAGAPDNEALEEAGRAVLARVVPIATRFAESAPGILVMNGFHSAFRDSEGVVGTRVRWLARLDEELADAVGSLDRCYHVDVLDLLARRSGGAIEDPKLRHLAAMRLGDGALGELARVYTRFLVARKGLTRKCIVLDLDNTLWGGIVGEDGPHGIKLGATTPGSEFQEFQRYLQALTRQGFLLAINSKNNPEDALEVIRSHPGMILREDAFSAMRINWRPKTENIANIANELNIGTDALVFVDDKPEEREMMRRLMPEVLTPEMPADPSLYRATLEALPQLQKLEITGEDRERVKLYRVRRKRQQAMTGAGSLEDYLHSLEIQVTCEDATPATLPRLEQMFARTNQFNLTTRRYTTADLEAFVEDPACRLLALRASDRFGDHGIVAATLVRVTDRSWRIDSFLMSCRVIGYGIETALLAELGQRAGRVGAASVVGEYIPTAKNTPASDFYARHGFRAMSETGAVGETQLWERSLVDGPPEVPAWIRVQDAHAP